MTLPTNSPPAAAFQPTPKQLADWVRMESSMRMIQAMSMKESDDEDERRMHSGFLASALWMEKAADRLDEVATEPPAPAANEMAEAIEKRVRREVEMEVIRAAYRPKPRCRDCADNDGRRPNDGTLCDPYQAALERLREMPERPWEHEAARAFEEAYDRNEGAGAWQKLALAQRASILRALNVVTHTRRSP